MFFSMERIALLHLSLHLRLDVVGDIIHLVLKLALLVLDGPRHRRIIVAKTAETGCFEHYVPSETPGTGSSCQRSSLLLLRLHLARVERELARKVHARHGTGKVIFPSSPSS